MRASGTLGQMILIALGANLPTDRYGPPEEGVLAALRVLPEYGIRPIRRSRLYRTAPVPPSGQPWYVNAVAEVASDLPPQAPMAALLSVERAFGRERSVPNAARTLDLDLIDVDEQVGHWPADRDLPDLVLPHPRLAERAFVLVPLAELVPNWRHPVSGTPISALVRGLPPGQTISAIKENAGDP